MKENHLVEIERNLKLWVETFGNRRNEACVFISGAGANSSFWSDCLCEKLEQEGFFAMKYDHRDIGFSSKTDFENNPYNVLKLAEDVLSIINSFEIEKAHFIGHSMGGFIVQLLAIHFP